MDVWISPGFPLAHSQVPQTCLVLFLLLNHFGPFGGPWLSLACVVPGPEASDIIGTAASSKLVPVVFLHVLGRLWCARTHVASCACLIATSYDTITSTSISEFPESPIRSNKKVYSSPGCVYYMSTSPPIESAST